MHMFQCVTKELEKKRKAAGKEEPKLTKKQQEAVQAQLQKEAASRAQLIQVNTLNYRKKLRVACTSYKVNIFSFRK